METITSVNNEQIKYIYSLLNKKNRIKNKEYIIEGYHLVEMAYQANLLKIILSTDKNELNKYSNIKTLLVNDNIIKKLSTTITPQNIIGVATIRDNQFIEANRYIIIDNLQDPGNLGTIIRTAISLGVKDILISKDSVDCYNEKVIRATQGAIFKANIYIDDLNYIYELLKLRNIPIITTDLKAQTDLKNLQRFDKFGLVVGSEARGISDISKKYADVSVVIPLKNDMESLNASIALSIVLYELIK